MSSDKIANNPYYAGRSAPVINGMRIYYQPKVSEEQMTEGWAKWTEENADFIRWLNGEYVPEYDDWKQGKT